MPLSHDRLFKELLRTFLFEFLELFIPELIAHLEREPPVFLEPRLFTDVTAGETHCADLVARVRLRGAEAFLLVHIESQAQPAPEFERRMFRYFARLHETYVVPIVPIALLSDRAGGRKAGRDRYVVAAPHRPVVTFHFHLSN